MPRDISGKLLSIDESTNKLLKSKYWPGGINAALDRIINLKKEGAPLMAEVGYLELLKKYYANPNIVKNLQCMGGFSMWFIYGDGSVRLCNYRLIGNLLLEDPAQIWNISIIIKL